MPRVRVATSQYHTGMDVQENLDKLLSVIDQAADGGARLIVSPEFGNHASAWSSKDYCWEVSLDLDGPFVSAVRQKARERRIYVVFNATIRAERPNVFDSNIFVGPDGEIIGTTSKQVLIGMENDFCTPGQESAQVFETQELGRVGMFSCMDGVIPETARALAVKGAQVLVNTLNSMALEEPSMHIPVRAAENHVWVVASNKSGPIVPVEMLGPIAERLGTDPHVLIAPGEAQIITPTGKALATGGFQIDDVVFADIEPELADDKRWEDGDLMADRRPPVYGILATPSRPRVDEPGPGPVTVAAVQVRHDRPPMSVTARALDLALVAAREGARLVVLPELFAFDAWAVAADPASAARTSGEIREQVEKFAAEHDCFVAYSGVDAMAGQYRHTGTLIGPKGRVVGECHQVHVPNSFRGWATPGERFDVWDTAIGRIGMMLGYDGVFPESASILARMGADIIVYPTTWRLPWEVDLGILERAGENHVSVIAAARWDSPVQRGSLIIPATKLPRSFDGELNPVRPIEVPVHRETYVAVTIDPANSRCKEISNHTDLLGSRRPELYGGLVGKA